MHARLAGTHHPGGGKNAEGRRPEQGRGREIRRAGADDSDKDAAAAAAGSAPPPIVAVCDQARASVAALPSVAELLSFEFDFTVSRSQRLHGAQRHHFLAPTDGGQPHRASAAAAAGASTGAAADAAAAAASKTLQRSVPCGWSRPPTIAESSCTSTTTTATTINEESKTDSGVGGQAALDRAQRTGRAHSIQRAVNASQSSVLQYATISSRVLLSRQDSRVA